MFVEQLQFPKVCCPISVQMTPFNDPLISKLSLNDQAEFFRLIQFFQFSDDRNKRNLGLSTFAKHLQLIHNFINKGDGIDSYRGLVCGIQFGVNSLLINTSRLKKLMFRSKSCMNGCFQKLGFHVCRPNQDISTTLAQLMPRIDPMIFNPRQWCVRYTIENSTTNFSPIINIRFGESPQQSSQDESQPETIDLSLNSLLNRKPQLPSILRM